MRRCATATICRCWFTTGAILAASIAAAGVRADDADDQFAVAAGHYDRQQWKLAVEEFRVFLKDHPNDRRANASEFFLGEALLQSADFDAARQQFQRYASLEPDGKYAKRTLFRMGEAAYLADAFAAAKTDLQRFREKHPDDALNAFVLPYLGNIALSSRACDEGATLFRDALMRFPDGQLQDECRVGLARSLEGLGRTGEAESLYAAVVAKTASPSADAARFHWGALQYTTGKYDLAIASFSAFENRLADSPWRPNAMLGHGWALFKQGKPEAAIPMFEAVAGDPKLGVEARYWLGLAQKAKMDWSAASVTLRTLAEANPTHALAPAIRFHAGDALLNAGDAPAAMRQFEAVLSPSAATPEHDEWSEQAARGRVQASLQIKDHAAVERLAAEFERQFPRGVLRNDVQRLLARSLVERKEFARAADLLKPMVDAAGLDSSDPQSRYLLALACDGLDRHEDALAALAPVVPSADGSLKSDAQLLQGSSLLALKRFSEAIAPLEAFLASKPTGDAAVKGMGELAISYARNNQLDRAKPLFAELAEKYAEHPLLLPTAEHLAEAAYDANDIAWSTELSARLAKSDPSSEYYRKGKLGLGWSQYKAGNLGEAADVFDQLLKANPPEGMAAEAAMARGQILERLEQEESAAAMYAVVIEQYPKSKQHGDALFAAARLCVKQKRHATAASHFERFAKDHAEAANLDVALYEWAWALLESNQGDASADRFRQLHQAHRESRYWGEAAYRLAQRAFEAKEYGQAAALAAEVLQGKSEPRVREYAAYLRGQIAVAQSDWPKTREAFETFVKEFGDSPQCIVAEFWIAETFYRQEDWKTASERFDRLAKQVETGREAWMAMIPLRRAQLAVQRNEWGEAFEIASRIAADFAAFEQHYEVDYVLGRCLANRADFEGARRAYGKVIQSTAGAKTETAAMAQWMIGESFFHQKNYKAALSEYLRLEILYAYPTWQSAALLQAGKCHELLGEGKEATELYRRIVTLYPDTPFAKEASQKLQDATARRTAGERTN